MRRAALLGAAGRRLGVGAATRRIRMARIVYAVDPQPTNPTATRYEWHALQGDHSADRARLKAANPSAEIVVYANPTVSRPSDPTGITGVYPASTFPDAWAMHTSGGAVMFRNVGGFSGSDWKMIDFTNTSFQTAAINFLVNKCQTDGWDGVLLDDLLPYNNYSTVYPGNIANDTAWETAIKSAITNIATGLKNAGLKVYGNVADQYHEAFWVSMSAQLTAGSQEGWIGVNSTLIDSIQNGRWTVSMTQAADAETSRQPHVFYVNTSSTTVARYALCSLLLVWQGYSRIAFAPDQSGADVYFTDIDNTASLGFPLGAATVDSTGVRRRLFEGGTVTVNPNESSQTAFGDTYAARTGTITITGGGGGGGGGSTGPVFDAVGPTSAGAATTGSTSLTWNHTCAGTNRLLTVAVAVGANPDTALTTTATYNGVAMTSVGRVQSNGVSEGYVQMFRLVAPATGTNTVAVTVSGGTPNALTGGSVSFTSVNQTTPLGTPATATGSVGGPTVALSGTTTGNLVVDAACVGSGISTSGQTLRWSRNTNTNTAAGNGASSTAAAGGTVTMSYSINSADFWGILAVEVRA
jgi:hypothetical protein